MKYRKAPDYAEQSTDPSRVGTFFCSKRVPVRDARQCGMQYLRRISYTAVSREGLLTPSGDEFRGTKEDLSLSGLWALLYLDILVPCDISLIVTYLNLDFVSIKNSLKFVQLCPLLVSLNIKILTL